MGLSPTTPPLDLYVVWHPNFVGDQGGAALFHRLFRTLSMHPKKVLSPGLGIPTYLRTGVTGGPRAPVPPAIELDRAQHSVVIVLVEQHLALDKQWVAYIHALADAALASATVAGRRHLVLPVLLLDRRFAPDFGRTQNIDLCEGVAPERLPVMLQLRVMSEICRLLGNMPRGGTGDLQLSPEPLQLFVSHAKIDGEAAALELLEKISSTPLAAFFDKQHITSGWDFSDEIRAQIRRSAVVALQSDAYASRPWCRREVLEAKRQGRPLVVVHRMREGEDRSFPYLGNVPTMGWTGENHFEIIAATVREYLRKVYVEARFQNLQALGCLPSGARHLVRPPELIDGLLFRRRPAIEPGEEAQATAAEQAATAVNPQLGEAPKQLAIYPDPPLGREELEVLADFLPEMVFATPTTLADETGFQGRTIALSLSESADLTSRGLDHEHHLLAAMAEIARHVLARDGVLAYGGDLRPAAQGGFLDELLDLVRAYGGAGLATRPVLDFLAWPLYLKLDADPESKLLLQRVADLEFVPPPPDVFQRCGVTPETFAGAEAEPYLRARCLTAMRVCMTQRLDARILLGGKATGFSGKYPGLVEEAALALTARKPLYLIGAFGGCAGLLTRWVRGEHVEELTLDYQLAHSPPVNAETTYGRLVRQYQQYGDDDSGPIDYGRLRSEFSRGVSILDNGLTAQENDELFDNPNLDRIVFLLMKGLSTRLGSK